MATILQEGQVKTNNVGLAYAVQTALGQIPTTGWETVEWNALNTFGNTITRTARTPVSRNRQNRKGSVTDLDSSLEYDTDLTVSSFRDHAAGFVFARGINSDVTQIPATATTGTGFTVAAVSAAQATRFDDGTLVWASGATAPVNNGLHQVNANIASGDTEIQVSTSLTAETAAIRVSFAGWRIASADTVTWTWDGANNQATLAETGIGTQLQALGVIPGMFIHIGSVSSIGGDIQNAFENDEANDMFGFARVVSVSADAVVFDKVSDALQFTDSTDPATPIDLVFGEFFRNVATDDTDFCEFAFCYEASSPGLGDGTPGNTDTSYEYSLDNFCNTMEFQLPLTDKATISYGFVGSETHNPTTTRATGAAAAVDPTQTAAFNTSADIARLRITDTDEDGLTTDFKSLTMTLNNNVSPEKVLGRLGARFLNTGNFVVTLDAQLLFTSPRVVAAIRNNQTLSMDFVVKNDDGTIAVDIPSMTLGDGSREYPVNESVLINTTVEAFEDPTLGTSVGISVMPVPLP